MSRRVMFVLAFVLVAAAVGQLSAGAQAYPGYVNYGGYVTTGVPVVPGAVVVSPAPATPTATFAAPPPTAGISDAGRAGISDVVPMPSTLPSQSSTVVYINQAPVETIIPGAPGAVVENAVVAASGGSSAPVSESGGRTVNDLGPSYYSDALPAGRNTSLGEISSQFKAFKATVNARVLTNDDVHQMVDSKGGVTMAKNMPPLGPGSREQSGQAQTTGSQAGTQSAQSTSKGTPPGSSANQPAQNATTSQGGTPPPASAGQSQSSRSAENSTTPQINQNQQSNDARGSKRLPATATFLPLLGLLGLATGGIGLWFRKFRK
jgi:hypothetical protein